MLTMMKPGRRPGPVRFLAFAAVAVVMVFVTKAMFPQGPDAGREGFLGTITVQSKKNAPPKVFRAGEPYRIIVEPTSSVYFYIFRFAPDGSVEALFPTTVCELENPLEKPCALPSEKSAFVIEGAPGEHWILAVASGTILDGFDEAFEESFLVKLRQAKSEQMPELIRNRIESLYTRQAFITVQLESIEVSTAR